jgi:hypothetical protein
VTLRARLVRFAERRVASAPGPLLVDDAAAIIADRRLVCEPLVPWDMSVGAHSPVWAELTDAQRLAANHLMYVVHYQRIMSAEVYSIVANRVMASFVRPAAPALADLLLRENAEEEDHIEAFTRVSQRVAEHHGFGDLQVPNKPLRRVFVQPAFVAFVLATFGVDYVVVHFLGRGHLNHMGRAFERPIASLGGVLTRLTEHHVEDEAKHLAASALIAAEAPAVLGPGPKQRLLYGAWVALMRDVARWAVFDERVTDRQESRMYRRALARMPAFRGAEALAEALVQGHFAGESGVQRAKNASIGRPNQRLVDQAALDEQARRDWVTWMRAHQGRIRHYPPAGGSKEPGATS